MKIFFIKSIIASLLVTSFLTAPFISINAQANDSPILHGNHNLMGSHGMVLIYHPEEGFFVSHLPLYLTPHDYQLIYKIQVAEPEKLTDLLKNDMVTLLPANFDLSRLIVGERFSINTTFFQGHFERGGKSQFSTDMTFEKPILIKKVSPTFTSTKAVTFLAPISEQNAIFAHRIQKPPSFDAIGFVNSATVNDKFDTLICDKPSKLSVETIKAKLTACAKFDVKYIETQDFK